MRNLWKRMLAVALAASMVLQGIPAGMVVAEAAEAVETADEELVVVEALMDSSDDVVASGTCGENLTWVLDSEGTLTISGTGDMKEYDYELEIIAPWYEERSCVCKVVIESGVTSIGEWAFYKCGNLTKVAIPDSVTSIGSYAFYECSSLESAIIPEGVTSIGMYTFYECTSLTSMIIPDSVTSIGSYAFYNSYNLASITVSDNIVFIGRNAFWRTAYYLDESNWENGVLYLGKYLINADRDSLDGSYEIKDGTLLLADYAFYDCKDLVSITIPDSLSAISSSAFSCCVELENVVIPDSVTSIGSYAFYRCEVLSNVYYTGTEEQWGSIVIETENGAFNIATFYYNFTGFIEMSNCNITLSSSSYFYNGFMIEPDVTVTYNGVTLTGGIDYIVSYSDNTNVGTATVTVDGMGIYTGIATATFTISKASQTLSVSSTSVSLAVGGTSTPTVSGAKTSLTYKSSNTSVATVNSSGKITAKAVGTATITVTAAQTSAYSKATKTIKVTVKPAATTISKIQNTTSGVKLTWSKVTGATKYYVYRSTSKSGTYTKIGETTSTSYTNKNSGTNKVSSGKTYYYKVYAYASTGKSAASSAKSIRYLAGKVSSLTNTSSGITVKWSQVNGASGYYIYRKAGSGSYKQIATVSSASTTSYTNKTTGTYKVVNGTTYTYYVMPYYKSGSTVIKGTYSATKKTVRMTAVSISSVKNSSSKKMTVKWSKNSKATGYQIQYSTSSKFTSSTTKTVTVSGAATVSKTIGSLTKNKKYYVRICSYKTVSGTKYCSAWSSAKSVKISK